MQSIGSLVKFLGCDKGAAKLQAVFRQAGAVFAGGYYGRWFGGKRNPGPFGKGIFHLNCHVAESICLA